MEEAKQLAALSSLEDLRASTVAILSSQLASLSTTLDVSQRQLVSSLDHHVRSSSGATSEEKAEQNVS